MLNMATPFKKKYCLHKSVPPFLGAEIDYQEILFNLWLQCKLKEFLKFKTRKCLVHPKYVEFGPNSKWFLHCGPCLRNNQS